MKVTERKTYVDFKILSRNAVSPKHSFEATRIPSAAKYLFRRYRLLKPCVVDLLGYTGPLCDSCASSYGRSRSFRCEPCRSDFANIALALFSVIVLLVLSAFAIRSSISSKIIRFRSATGMHPSSGPSPSTSRGGVSHIPPKPLSPLSLEMIEMLRKGHSPSEILEHIQSQQQPPSSSSSSSITQTLTTPGKTEEEALLAKWKAVEIFKVPKTVRSYSLCFSFFLDDHQPFASDRRGHLDQRGLNRSTNRPLRCSRLLPRHRSPCVDQDV